MSKIKQAISNILESVSAKNRYLSGLALSSYDYYHNFGRYKDSKALVRSLKTGNGFRLDNFDYKILPPDATESDEITWQVVRDRDGYNKLHETFLKYPHSVSKYFAHKYVKIFKEKGSYAANTFFRKTLGAGGVLDKRVQLANSHYFDKNKPSRLYLAYSNQFTELHKCTKSQIETLAKQFAIFVSDLVHFEVSITNNDFQLDSQCEESLAHYAYKILVNEFNALKLDLPYFTKFRNKKLTEREALTAIAKVTDFEWWLRQLKKRRDQQYEHLAIAFGQVQKKATPYASRACCTEWLESKKRNREWAKNQVIENEDTGEQFELTLQIDKSNANPAIRRCELMVRMRGFEDLADEYGYVGAFITITAPSKYHSCHSEGGFVKNWEGYSPRVTHRYLCNVWAKIRASLSRNKIKVFGFRVVEPHHDGAPHWHLLVFMLPEHRDNAKAIMSQYALKEDSNEPGAKENRFKFVDIEKEKGTATGYIAKYISKNIDGYALDGEIDNETGKNLKDIAKSITTWASRWRIRQFQQIGGAPVTVYRELRRLKDQKVEDKNIDPVLAAANVGDWAAYTEHQGGAMVERKDVKVRTSYENSLNQYEEVQQKIKGVFSPLSGTMSFICTRLIKWRIIRKRNKKEVDIKKRKKRASCSNLQ